MRPRADRSSCVFVSRVSSFASLPRTQLRDKTTEGTDRADSDLGSRLALRYMTPPQTPDRLQVFRRTVLDHYREHGRDLPWRRTRDPYAILVSEFMLQQTQVARVLAKYQGFLGTFPTVGDLSGASIAKVLSAWQGLGYNRRALSLHQTAEILVREHGGGVPDSPRILRGLPGIGPATSAAVCVFAYDNPLVFIETNIRAAFIHFFFQECVSIPDSAILPLVELTLDCESPRDWYYALMDYGVWVKRNFANPGRRSLHHSVQTPFAGSPRQLRAGVLRVLVSASPTFLSAEDVHASVRGLGSDEARVRAALEDLAAEGFLTRSGDSYGMA